MRRVLFATLGLRAEADSAELARARRDDRGDAAARDARAAFHGRPASAPAQRRTRARRRRSRPSWRAPTATATRSSGTPRRARGSTAGALLGGVRALAGGRGGAGGPRSRYGRRLTPLGARHRARARRAGLRRELEALARRARIALTGGAPGASRTPRPPSSGSPRASVRSSSGSRSAGPTARSPTNCSSASRRPASTSPTSSPSSAPRTAWRRPRSPIASGWCRENASRRAIPAGRRRRHLDGRLDQVEVRDLDGLRNPSLREHPLDLRRDMHHQQPAALPPRARAGVEDSLHP